MNACERTEARLRGDPVDRVPVQPIIMTFGARYAGVPYGKYVQDYRELVRAQLKVLEDFDLDVVTLCSDPCREAADIGAPIRHFPDQPPTPDHKNALLSEKSTLKKLKVPDPLGGGRMHDRVKGVEALAREVGGSVPILGWIEGPIAEGADLRGINRIMYDVVTDRPFVEDLFAFVLEVETQFAKAQIEAGADWIGIGDAAASLVDPDTYNTLVMPAERELIRRVHELGARVRLHICGKIDHILPGMARVGADMIDVDSLTDIGVARKHLGGEVLILGNLDPVKHCAEKSPEEVIEEVKTCAAKVGDKYVVGAGCELPPHTPPENLHAMVKAGEILARS